MKMKKTLYYVLVGFFALVFLFSSGYIVNYLINSRQQSNLNEDLASIVATGNFTRPTFIDQVGTKPTTDSTEATQPDSGTSTTAPETDATTPGIQATTPKPTSPRPNGGSSGSNNGGNTSTNNNGSVDIEKILPQYLPIYQRNNDTVGWITIEGTNINYPVVQSPNRKDYYLNHSFEKKWSVWGAIYVREACNVNTPSDNITLYGHQMKDGSMFSRLHNYKYMENWQAHPYIYFDTLYEYHTYKIFAVFKTTVKAGGFPYHLFVNAVNEAEFNTFIQTAKDLSLYETGITPVYGDKIITLSTCDAPDDDARFVVMAVRIS